MNLNKVILVGRLTQTPEMKTLPTGTGVVNTTMAVSRIYNDKGGARQEQTEFVKLVFFGRTAEVVAQYCVKGSLILTEGRIQTKVWEKGGEKRYTTEVVVDSMQLGPRPKNWDDEKNEQAEEINPDEVGGQEEVDVSEIPF